MFNSWGNSWGSSWGSSWGLTYSVTLYVDGTLITEYEQNDFVTLNYTSYIVEYKTLCLYLLDINSNKFITEPNPINILELVTLDTPVIEDMNNKISVYTRYSSV